MAGSVATASIVRGTPITTTFRIAAGIGAGEPRNVQLAAKLLY